MPVPVFARAAHAGAGEKRAVLPHGHRGIPYRVPMGDGLIGDVLHHAQADGVVEFVHAGGVIGSLCGARRARGPEPKATCAPVISFAMARPVQPPPTIATFTGLRRFISLSRILPLRGTGRLNGKAMSSGPIPSTLLKAGAARFWLAVLGTGVATGLGAAALTRLLEVVQKLMWGGDGRILLAAAMQVPAWRHIAVLLGAAVVTGVGQIVLKRLTSGNNIDTSAAIWFEAGRLPALADARQRGSLRDYRGDGRIVGTRGRAETGRGGVRELVLRSRPPFR